jgi:hypothetical protein
MTLLHFALLSFTQAAAISPALAAGAVVLFPIVLGLMLLDVWIVGGERQDKDQAGR